MKIFECEIQEALERIQEALKKQDSKEPEEQEFGGFGDKVLCCSSCHEPIRSFMPNYCVNCGQKLKWSEEQ